MKVIRGSALQPKVEPPATIRVFMTPDSGMAALSVTEVELAVGSATSDHAHDTDQVVYVLEGEARFVAAGERHDLVAGDLIYIPSGSVHRHECAGATPLRQLSVFVPPRGG